MMEARGKGNEGVERGMRGIERGMGNGKWEIITIPSKR